MREHEREARQLALLDTYERALADDPAAPPPPGLDPGLATVALALARHLGGPPPGRAAAPTPAFRSALRRRLEEQAARYHTTPVRDVPPATGGNGATIDPIVAPPHRAPFRPRAIMPATPPRKEWSAATPTAAARPDRPDAAPPRRRPYRAALATGAGWLGALLVFLAVLLVATLLLRGLPGTTPAARPPLSPTPQRDGTPTIAATAVPPAPVAPTEPRAPATPTVATPVVVPLWRPTGALAAVRARHSATRLADGRVLVAGGNSNGGDGVAASAELYDPQTGRWSATGAVAPDRRATGRPRPGQPRALGGRAGAARRHRAGRHAAGRAGHHRAPLRSARRSLGIARHGRTRGPRECRGAGRRPRPPAWGRRAGQ